MFRHLENLSLAWSAVGANRSGSSRRWLPEGLQRILRRYQRREMPTQSAGDAASDALSILLHKRRIAAENEDMASGHSGPTSTIEVNVDWRFVPSHRLAPLRHAENEGPLRNFTGRHPAARAGHRVAAGPGSTPWPRALGGRPARALRFRVAFRSARPHSSAVSVNGAAGAADMFSSGATPRRITQPPRESQIAARLRVARLRVDRVQQVKGARLR